MNKEILKFLKDYNTDEDKIDRLLVSAFIYTHTLKSIKNTYIQELLIDKNSDEYTVLESFLILLDTSQKLFKFEELLEFFEFVISPSDKLINGAIYTPKYIRQFITKKSFEDISKKDYLEVKVVDIACGSGGFLIDAALELKRRTGKKYKEIFSDNIFGLDIQEYSIKRTKVLLILFAIYHDEDEEEFEFNLYTGNSLTFDWIQKDKKIKKDKGFDIVLGNPPYVCSRNMDEETKSLMSKWSVCKSGHPDLYIPFFQIGYELLKKGGVLGFITVSTFIKSLNGRAIREYFSENKTLLKIIDFEDEQVFNGRTTYTCLCFLEKKESDSIYYTIKKSSDLNNQIIKFKKINYTNLSSLNGWHLKNPDAIKKIESTGTPFGDIYTTKSGIATLRNSIYIIKPLKEDDQYYYIDNNICIEKNICKDIVNSNYHATKKSITSLIEKIIFPYEYLEKKPILISENKFKKQFPKAYNYLLSHKDSLLNRDHGKGKYQWYEYGRNQSMEIAKYKLLFPQLAREGFHSSISNNKNLYFNNGMAALSDNLEELQILQKIFMSDIFWLYVKSTSKYYSSSYYSLGRNYIKNFGIYDFSSEDKKKLLKMNDKKEINQFLFDKYNITI